MPETNADTKPEAVDALLVNGDRVPCARALYGVGPRPVVSDVEGEASLLHVSLARNDVTHCCSMC